MQNPFKKCIFQRVAEKGAPEDFNGKEACASSFASVLDYAQHQELLLSY